MDDYNTMLKTNMMAMNSLNPMQSWIGNHTDMSIINNPSNFKLVTPLPSSNTILPITQGSLSDSTDGTSGSKILNPVSQNSDQLQVQQIQQDQQPAQQQLSVDQPKPTSTMAVNLQNVDNIGSTPSLLSMASAGTGVQSGFSVSVTQASQSF